PPPPPPPPRVPTEAEIWAGKSVDDLMREGVLADVYFDFDMYGVREDARGPLQTNADYLKKWPSLRITVEGHCDERGTSEYNLSLGERRSNAVQGYLVSLGIAADRITVISKGKETPFCTESNEACWQQNRRGHFVITGK
ncbi:MAG TPA: peptidoglycan-associated lipoprotein Pal, partial [Vicinamibacterales bacterium]|nr:peptidoglycan-associated lipoprotein Pal [Vicinamibacterales bacterium]